MKPIGFSPAMVGCLLFALAASPAVRAQVQLYAERDGAAVPVVLVKRQRPFVRDARGRLVAPSSPRYSLRPAREYAPALVTTKNVQVVMQAVDVIDTDSEINHAIQFRGDFESAFDLPDVFVAISLSSRQGGKMMLLQEIGHLRPHEPRHINVVMPLAVGLGRPRYFVHVFSKGDELFQSGMSPAYVHIKLAAMVARRIRTEVNAPVREWMVPQPKYPERLRRRKVRGRAVIQCTIAANGRPQDSRVVSATDPAFGEAALASVRQAWFLPRVVGGVPQATTFDLPFDFGGN